MKIIAKRQGQRIFRWTERLHIPLPSLLKAEVRRVARENDLSVSAWGFGIVHAAISNPLWMEAAIAQLALLQEQATKSEGSRE